MKQIIALIQKIKDGTATASDVALLENMLAQEEDAARRQSLQETFDHTVASGEQVLTPEKTAAMLKQLHRKMTPEQIPARHRIGKLLPYAAAVAGLLLLAGMAMMYYHTLPKQGRNSIVKAAPQMKLIRNTTGKAVMITLPEGSAVTMEAGATLLYADSALRNVTLQGKAFFEVKANTNNPFTVNAGNIESIALGTRFTVDARQPQAVTVKLETGKVRVHAKDGTTREDIYLLPGEAVHFDHAIHQYAIEKTAADKTSKNTGVTHAVLMTFNNAPLDSVLNKLAAVFHTPIRYDHSDADGAYFTGQVLKTDPLRNILEVICELNNLELTQEAETMMIRKTR